MCTFDFQNWRAISLSNHGVANVKERDIHRRMKFLPSRWRSVVPIVLLLVAGHSGICFNSAAPLTPEEIVRKAFRRAHGATDDSRRADYAYNKRVIVEELD